MTDALGISFPNILFQLVNFLATFSYNIYINLDVNTTVINYTFSVPYNTFGNYTRLIVDFMSEDQLDQYLNVEWGNNK